MREELLYYLWQHKKFDARHLETSSGVPLQILHPGMRNHHAGPDFFNARLMLAQQEWAGNVEVHVNSSDWYAHRHEQDPQYDNVLLHLVWNHDVEVFRKDNSPIPVLELKRFVSPQTLNHYQQLLEHRNGKWINCESRFGQFNDFLIEHWLERLYIERLEKKTLQLYQLLEQCSNNWEEVLFLLLAKSFGLNLNGEAFLQMARSIPFRVVQKASLRPGVLEALFLGQAGLLDGHLEDFRYRQLQDTYMLWKAKYQLQASAVPVSFFRLRPDNFPSIRLVQLASLYESRKPLFSKVAKAATRKEIYNLFRVDVPVYWQTHYSFQKEHPKRLRRLTKSFVDLLIINTLAPLKYCLGKHHGQDNGEEILELMTSLRAETNGIVGRFNKLRPGTASHALGSQALLQLKTSYCDSNKCLSCNLGMNFLQQKA